MTDAALGNNAEQVLRGFAERVQRLEEEKKALQGDIDNVFAEAKAAGFNDRALKKAIRELGMDKDKRQLSLAFDIEVDMYRKALGMPSNEDSMIEAARKRISEASAKAA